jgi:hypothetical protein
MGKIQVKWLGLYTMFEYVLMLSFTVRIQVECLRIWINVKY